MCHTIPRWCRVKLSSMSNNELSACCPLCLAEQTAIYFKDRQREYWSCLVCALIYVPACFHLTPSEERKRYDSHQNSASDPAYRSFLNRLMTPLLRYLQPGQQGLDFGCGPGPTLSVMLQERGYPMSVYDPFYANDASLLQKKYDFITCSEAIEHFKRPDQEWRRLLSLLVEGGTLAIMTQLHQLGCDFGRWYYKNDPTHICFFSRQTFEWLAKRYHLKVMFDGDSVAIFYGVRSVH